MFLSIFVLLTAFPSLAATETAHCFLREDSQKLKFEVRQLAPPPVYSEILADYAPSSPTYPVSTYATGAIDRVAELSLPSASGFRFQKQYFLWTNRCIFMRGKTPDLEQCRNTSVVKGNYYRGFVSDPATGQQLRPAFSTYEKANLCTALQAERLLGGDLGSIRNRAVAAGLRLSDRSDRSDAVAEEVVLHNGSTRKYFVDACFLEPMVAAADLTGVTLDYEPHDRRTPEETLRFLQRMTSVVKNRFNKELTLFTNDLGSGGVRNGIDATNVRQIINLVAAFAPIVWSGATLGNEEVELNPRGRVMSPLENLRRQIAIMTAGGAPLRPEMKRKILLTLSLFEDPTVDASTRLEESRALHEEILANGYRGVMIWRNFASQGGACDRIENQVTACVAFGRCDGRYAQGDL